MSGQNWPALKLKLEVPKEQFTFVSQLSVSLCVGDGASALPLPHFWVSRENERCRVSWEHLAFLGINSGLPDFLRLCRFKTRRFL